MDEQRKKNHVWCRHRYCIKDEKHRICYVVHRLFIFYFDLNRFVNMNCSLEHNNNVQQQMADCDGNGANTETMMSVDGDSYGGQRIERNPTKTHLKRPSVPSIDVN